VDIYLDVGKIDNTLPFIKREATRALAESYPDVDTAKKQIAARLTEFYGINYPEIWNTDKASVNNAIDMVRDIYAYNSFPEMNVDWRTYPDNIGHLISPGCFRCHDGSHVNQRGERLSHECNICHDFLNPVDPGGNNAVIQAGEFIHSYELQGPHADLRCDRCHTGGVAPVPTCAGCHTEQVEFSAGTAAAFEAFQIEPDPMDEIVECESCHDLSEPTRVEAIDAMCLDCHEDEQERFAGMLAGWQEEVEQLLARAENQVDTDGELVLEALRRAGPLHNIEATRKIIRGLSTAGVPASQP
jgi:formate-dependent nitrite reductase cytochrome c552 subunit